VAALDRLSKAGVSLGCQTVLLKGVNDDAKVMMKLMHELLKARVRPYYIFMADQVAGGEHFRTTVQKGLEIMQALRGWTSGLAVPQFVIDSPGGGGKVPLLPEYVESITEDEVVFRNYEGKRFAYKQPHTAPAAPVEVVAAEVGVVPIGRKKAATPRRTKRRRAAGE
jgi:lysine 2,3-aminomutase